MNKNLLFASTVFLLSCAATTHAENIGTFIGKSNATASFNCAYKRVIASKKCTVSISTVKASTTRTKQFFGANGTHPLLKIKWPDNDVSQYVIADSNELWNLSDNDAYNFKTKRDDEFKLDLQKGLIIEKDFKEHVRLW